MANSFLRNVTTNSKHSFILLAIAALVTAYIPFLHIPLSWAETFFHEISHGIAALFTGGSIVRIVLNLDGSGLCYTRGGIRFITAFAGYAGAVFWGACIYSLALNTSTKNINVIASLLAFLLIASAVLYARDITTWGIMLVIFLVFFAIIKLRNGIAAQLALKFIGLYILFNAIRSPLHLLDGQHRGDGATMQDLLLLPELVWIIIWIALGLLTTLLLWKKTK